MITEIDLAKWDVSDPPSPVATSEASEALEASSEDDTDAYDGDYDLIEADLDTAVELLSRFSLFISDVFTAKLTKGLSPAQRQRILDLDYETESFLQSLEDME